MYQVNQDPFLFFNAYAEMLAQNRSIEPVPDGQRRRLDYPKAQ